MKFTNEMRFLQILREKMFGNFSRKYNLFSEIFGKNIWQLELE